MFAHAPCLIRPAQLAVRSFSSQTSGDNKAATPCQPPKKPLCPPPINGDVPGLSERCVLPRCEPLGPGASLTGVYKVPEYFKYDRTSFAEAEVELACFRGPQPNANRKA